MSRLEALPGEVLISILSAADTLNDLSAFIRASPIVYSYFLLARPSILLGVCATELGPGFRDVRALATFELVQPPEDETLVPDIQDIRAFVNEYTSQLLSDAVTATIFKDEDIAVKVAKLTRAALYLADIFTSFRFRYFLHSLEPACDWPATPSERRRISQALLRSQIFDDVIRACCRGPTERDPADEHLAGEIIDVLEPWELEQMSLMGLFVDDLHATISLYEGNIIRNELDRHVKDIVAFRRRVLTNMAEFEGVEDKLKEMMLPHCFTNTSMVSGYIFYSSRYGGFRGSPADASPAGSADASQLVSYPPWGWVDLTGHQLKEGQWEWSDESLEWDILPIGMIDQSPEAQEQWRIIKSWRALGNAFWDKDRVEAIRDARRTTRKLGTYPRGSLRVK